MSQTMNAIPLASLGRADTPSLVEPRDALAQSPDTPDETSIAGDQQSILSHTRSLSTSRITTIIAQLTVVQVLSSFSNGVLTVCIPAMARDLQLPQHLIYWPSSVFGLTSGSCLILAGAIADVVGGRVINLVGTFLLGGSALGCGLANNGYALIAFRALQGIAIAMCLPSSVGILTRAIASGRTRNTGLACLGMGQSIGFALGLVLGGVLLQTAGWRSGFYIAGCIGLLLSITGIWVLPKDPATGGHVLKRLWNEIDWIGAGIASTCLALLAYVLAAITTSISYIKHPANIVLLTISLALAPTFVFWVGRQERLSRPVLISNALWRNKAFTSTCLMVLLIFAMIQTMELFSSLFFQQVQHFSALETSLRFLPSVIFGAILNLTTGLVIHRVSAFYLILVTCSFSAGAPLLMALIDPTWPYWYDAFFAQLLLPLSADVLFTAGILVVSEVFPDRMQGLAGAVFNTLAQFGSALGLAVTAVISTAVTQQSPYADKHSIGALLDGYRAGFWACFAWMIVACAVSAYGLRGVGKLGLKRD